MTTIAVKDDTFDMLEHVKEQVEAQTYDETIKILILQLKKPKESMFGKLKEIKEEFKRGDLDRFA